MKIGYARVSTAEQSLRMQIDALRAAGCERIFEDRGVSGAAVIKPAFSDMLRMARPGDEIIVWRLDRLARSLSTLIDTVRMFDAGQFAFRSLHENIETVTPGGRFFFHVMAALAEFERDIIADRTRAGVAAARAAGKRVGRPPQITEERWAEAKALLNSKPPLSVVRVATLLGVTRQALYRRIAAERATATVPSQGDTAGEET